MAREKKHMPEQVVNLLRQIEVGVANGKTTPVAFKLRLQGFAAIDLISGKKPTAAEIYT